MNLQDLAVLLIVGGAVAYLVHRVGFSAASAGSKGGAKAKAGPDVPTERLIAKVRRRGKS